MRLRGRQCFMVPIHYQTVNQCEARPRKSMPKPDGSTIAWPVPKAVS